MARHDWIKNGLLADRVSLATWLAACTLYLALLPLGLWKLDPQFFLLAKQTPLPFRRFMADLTELGRSHWELVPSGLLVIALFFLRRRMPVRRRLEVTLAQVQNLALFLFICIAGSGLLAQLLKQLFGRARPKHFEQAGPHGFHPFSFHSDYASMPSGHATTLFALAMIIALSFPRLSPPAFLVAAFISSSRLFVGAHFFTDIVAGALLGSLFVISMRGLFAHHRLLFERRESGFRLRGRRLLAGLPATVRRSLEGSGSQ